MKGAIIEDFRLRNIIKEYQFKPLKEKTRVTVSLGIASTPHKKIRNYDDLINFADNALFKAKEKGRYRIFTISSLS
jgi:diguanylate cyclase (GGDEF)-like protein